jgi:hypothetical protein
MVLAGLILILSTAFFFFYFQATCQRILRQQFEREYFLAIAKAVSLEFPAVRRTMAESNASVDYPRLHTMLKCDFLALAHLLKNTANVSRRYSNEERLLILYFRCQLLSLAVRLLLKVGEKKAILRMTSVLEYFANVIGQRVNTVGFRHSTAVSYLVNP